MTKLYEVNGYNRGLFSYFVYSFKRPMILMMQSILSKYQRKCILSCSFIKIVKQQQRNSELDIGNCPQDLCYVHSVSEDWVSFYAINIKNLRQFWSLETCFVM